MKGILTIIIAFIVCNLYAQKIVTADYADSFNEGVAPFVLNEKWGFINTEGEVIIEPKYLCGFDTPFCSEGMILLNNPEKDGWGYFDNKGNLVIDFTFYSASPFYDSLAASYDNTDHPHWRFLNKKGEIVVKEFKNHHSYSTILKEGRARVSYDFKCGFVDSKGNLVIEAKYDDVRDFSEGLAAVQLDGKWGFIDKDGNLVIDFKFTNEPQSFSNGRTFVMGQNFLYALIDNTGKVLVEPKYKSVFPFNEGFAPVSYVNEKGKTVWEIIDVNGKTVKQFVQTGNEKDMIEFYSGFSEGLAVAQQGYGANRGYIDTKGKVAIDFKFTMNIKPFKNNRAYAEYFDKKNKKTTKGFIDKTGKYVIVIEKSTF
jgi:hypothetical protein